MEYLAGLGELMFLLNMVWIVVGVPMWMILAAITLLGSRRSRAHASRASLGAAPSTPETSRLGRPAMVISVAVVAAVVLFAAVFAATVRSSDQGATSMASLAMSLAALLMVDVLSAALFAVSVALMRDVLTERRVAGRDAAVAYVVTLATYAVGVGVTLSGGVLEMLAS